MKNVYPVFFTKTESVVLVEVPDFEILAQGKTMSDAIEMARDAIELKCVSLEDDGIILPEPSEFYNLDIANGAFYEEGETVISYVDIDSTEYRRKTETKTVRRNVALPSWLNYAAEQAGINVSRVLQEALMKVLNIEQNFEIHTTQPARIWRVVYFSLSINHPTQQSFLHIPRHLTSGRRNQQFFHTHHHPQCIRYPNLHRLSHGNDKE